MKHLQALFFAFSLLLIYSCEYEPEGDYLSNIKKPTATPRMWTELNVSTDTVIVEQSGYLRFNFKADNSEIQWVQLLVDDKELGKYSVSSGEFLIDADESDLSLGLHKMTINAYIPTGSGSIADVCNAEGFIFSKTWTLILKENLYYSPKFPSIKPENGSLKITWEKFKGLDFKEYVILKSLFWGVSHDTLAVITDQEKTYVYDNNYIGERATYTLHINAKYRTQYYDDGIDYKDEVPKVNISSVNNHILTLTWNKSKFIKNIKGYEVYTREAYTGTYKLLQEINDSKDTSCVFDNLGFSCEHEFLLITIPNKTPNYIDDFWDKKLYSGSETKGVIGDKNTKREIFSPFGDYYYYLGNRKIFEYNYITKTTTDSISFNNSIITDYSVSPNRKYILAVTDQKVHLFNINSKEKTTYTIEELTGNPYGLYWPSISDNGKCIFSFGGSDILIYDFIQNKKIIQYKFDYWISSNKISADGKYFCNNNGAPLFEIQADTIIEKWKNTDEIHNSTFFDFAPDDPDLIWIKKGDYLYKKKISDLSNINSYNMPNTYIFNIDYNSNKALGHHEYDYIIYDLKTGDQVWSYPSGQSTYFNNLFLCNNTIYDSRFYVKLNVEY